MKSHVSGRMCATCFASMNRGFVDNSFYRKHRIFYYKNRNSQLKTYAAGVTELDSTDPYECSLPAEVASVDLLPSVNPMLLVVRALCISMAAAKFASILATTDNSPEGKMRRASHLEDILTDLGPTFVKLAQTLSMRPDLIGEVYAKSLAKLQDNVKPFSNAEAFYILEKELGRPISDVFQTLSREPVAAASLGQVYRGVLSEEYGGMEVAVKIQRPRVDDLIALDVQLLRHFIGVVQQLAGLSRDLRGLADEVGTALRGECDFRNEVCNSQIFMKAHENLTFITVPRAFPELCTRRILVSEWIHGQSPSQLIAAKDGKINRDILNLVRMGIQSSLAQLLVTGCMHGDPHSGNLLLTPDGRLCYLDFGLIVRVKPRHRQAMMAALIHLGLGEWSRLADDLEGLDLLKPNTDKIQLALELEKEFQNVMDQSPQDENVLQQNKDQLPLLSLQTSSLSFSTLARVLFRVAYKFRFKLPTYFPLVVRSISSLEGVALSVDPNFKLIAAGMPVVLNQLLSDRRPAAQKLLRELLLAPGGAIRTDETSRQILQVWLSAAKQEARTESYASESEGGKNLSTAAAVDMANLVLDRRNVPLRRTIMISNPAATIAAMPKDMQQQLLELLTQTVSQEDGLAAASTLLERSAHARAQRKRLWMLFKASVPKVLRSPPSSVLKLFIFTVRVCLTLLWAFILKVWYSIKSCLKLNKQPPDRKTFVSE